MDASGVAPRPGNAPIPLISSPVVGAKRSRKNMRDAPLPEDPANKKVRTNHWRNALTNTEAFRLVPHTDTEKLTNVDLNAAPVNVNVADTPIDFRELVALVKAALPGESYYSGSIMAINCPNIGRSLEDMAHILKVPKALMYKTELTCNYNNDSKPGGILSKILLFVQAIRKNIIDTDFKPPNRADLTDHVKRILTQRKIPGENGSASTRYAGTETDARVYIMTFLNNFVSKLRSLQYEEYEKRYSEIYCQQIKRFLYDVEAKIPGSNAKAKADALSGDLSRDMRILDGIFTTARDARTYLIPMFVRPGVMPGGRRSKKVKHSLRRLTSRRRRG